MKDKSTDDINKELQNINPDKLGQYYKDNRKYMVDDKKASYYYMKDTIEGKNIKMKDIYIAMGVSEKWGSSIFRQERHTKDRDVIIRMGVAGHLTQDELSKGLKYYGMQPLYPKDKRDACIIVALKNRIYDFARIDDMLEEIGCRILSKEIE